MSTTGSSSSELGIDLSKEAGTSNPPSPEKLKKGAKEGVDFMADLVSSTAEKHNVSDINPTEIAGTMMNSGPLGSLVEQDKTVPDVPTDFDPEHPYGKEAAEGKLPETHIPKEAIVNLLSRDNYESRPSGQQLSEIPQGLNSEEAGMWIENRLRAAEDTDEFRQTDSIGRLMGYINAYRFREGNLQDEVERKKLVQLVEIRGMLANSWLNLQVRNYEGFTALISQFLTGERLVVLKEKLPGLVEAISILEGKDDEVENSQGVYFRLRKSIPAEQARREQIEVSAKKAIENARQESLEDPQGVKTNNDKDIDTTMKLANTILNVSWMSAYYAGPVEQDIKKREILRDEKIFNNLNRPMANEEGDLNRYFTNRKLWETRRQERIKNGLGKYIKEPKPGNDKENLGDPAANARRLLDFPEEMEHSNPPIGNIQSLRYAAEIYILSLPHFFGYRSLKEFIEKSTVKEDKENGVKKFYRGDTFKWVNLIKGAGAAATALTDLVNEPLVGGEAVSDPKNFGNTIKNIGEVINKYQPYLELGYRDLFSYANSRIIESVFKFANGNSEDRRRFFPRWPKFGTWFLNSAVEAFSSKFNPDDRDELKRSLNSSDTALFRKDFGKQGASWLFKILQAFGSQVMKNK